MNIFPKVIFEDYFFMAIDKPSGWVVNNSDTTKKIVTLQDWLKENLNYELSSLDDFRSGIVHRLDKETSGILLVAKTKEMFYLLQDMFKARKLEKSYLTLVHGAVKEKEGKIEISVGRLPWNRKRFGALPGGREATTFYKLLGIYKKGNEYYSYLLMNPKTGRTHQIRIHLKYLNHPIVSDDFYAGRKTSRRDRFWCPRLFLHASEIRFIHPKNGRLVLVVSKLPSDLENVFHTLEICS